MRTVVRNAIFTGAALAAATGCGSRAETAGESPLVVANNGTMTTVMGPETTIIPTNPTEITVTTSIPKEVAPTTMPPMKESTTTTSTTRANQPDTLITDDGIGDLYIGQKKQDVEAAGYYLEPGCGENNFVAQNPQTSVSVDFVGGLVDQVIIGEFGPTTAEGIGIGSIREDVMQKLGKAGLGPTTSVFEGLHGNLNFINVDHEGTTQHFEIDGMDGAMRVSAVFVTRQGAEPVFSCE